jgi:hypothetical protein
VPEMCRRDMTMTGFDSSLSKHLHISRHLVHVNSGVDNHQVAGMESLLIGRGELEL